MVVLGLVGDRPDDVTTVEADGSAKGCECGNKHRHDDADKFDIGFHNFIVFVMVYSHVRDVFNRRRLERVGGARVVEHGASYSDE